MGENQNRWDVSRNGARPPPMYRDERREGYRQEGFRNLTPAYSPPAPERWDGGQSRGGLPARPSTNGASVPRGDTGGVWDVDDERRGWGREETSQSGAGDMLGDTGGGWGAAGYSEEGEDVGSAGVNGWDRGNAGVMAARNGAGGWPGLQTPARPSYPQQGQGWSNEDEREGGPAGGIAVDGSGRFASPVIIATSGIPATRKKVCLQAFVLQPSIFRNATMLGV